MMKFESYDTIEGYEVRQDNQSESTFYVLPKEPRFRIDIETGKPAFLFIKYREAIPREGKPNGGGYVFFDSEMTIPGEKLEAIKGKLQEMVNQTFSSKGKQAPQVNISKLSFTEGKVHLLLSEFAGGPLIKKVSSPTSPSLFGNNVASFAVELDELGATTLEQALKKAGMLQIIYEMTTAASLPPITATISFNATKFYSFYQQIDVDWNLWSDDSYRETKVELVISSEAMNVEIDTKSLSYLGSQDKIDKVAQQLRDWAYRTLEDAVARNMIKEITPASAEDRKLPGDIEHVTRNMMDHRISSFSSTYKENMGITIHPSFEGLLPSINSYKDIQGNPLKESDYFLIIDGNDAFFRTLEVAVMINANWKDLPLHSVEVHLDYAQGNTHTIEEPIFKDSDTIFKFKSFIENNVWKYKYWYQVNYKGQSQVFKSDVKETDEESLVISVDDIGILMVNISSGDLDFDKVKRAQVTVQYEDAGNGVSLIEREFIINKENREHKMVETLFKPIAKKYKYQVKYLMSDDTVFEGDPIWGQSDQLNINSPFSATKTIGIRSLGDMEKDISTIYVDLKYEDSKNKYIVAKSIALSKSLPFFDWSFPVLSAGGGKVTYSGIIQYKDGTSEDIPETEEKGNTIGFGGMQDILEIQVLSDLLDLNMIKLIKVSLSYKDKKIDAATGHVVYDIDENKDIIIRSGSTTLPVWTVKIKDKTKKSYLWQATFFMKDGSTKKTEPMTTSEPTIVLEVPK